YCVFFFSSRRRHTRFSRDWSSDVCSSDLRKGEIEKLLRCKGAGAYLLSQQLPGKTVRLDFSINPNEKPSYRNSWIKFPEGWKPCLPKPGGWVSCPTPPVFQTFKMNGQECTVYPNCTE